MSTKDLYRLTEGSNVWTFTSSNEEETYNGETYVPRVWGRSEINDNAQFPKNTLDVSMPLDDEVGQHFLKSPVDFVAKLDLYSRDDAGVYRTEWRGKLTKTAPDDTKVKMTFNSVFSSNRRIGARPVYQRTCRHALYGPGCTIDYNSRKVAGTVTGLSEDGLTLTIAEAASFAPGTLNAGVVEFSDGTMRYISSQSGSTVGIIRVSPTLVDEFVASGSAAVFLAPGCTQAVDWCEAVFDNLPNHGGFPYIPLKSPTGSAIA